MTRLIGDLLDAGLNIANERGVGYRMPVPGKE